jgi:arylformamidase
MPLIVAYGQHETDEFKRQSRTLFEAWQGIGGSCTSLQIDGRNHFDVILDLADRDEVLAQLALSLIRNSAS